MVGSEVIGAIRVGTLRDGPLEVRKQLLEVVTAIVCRGMAEPRLPDMLGMGHPIFASSIPSPLRSAPGVDHAWPAEGRVAVTARADAAEGELMHGLEQPQCRR